MHDHLRGAAVRACVAFLALVTCCAMFATTAGAAGRITGGSKVDRGEYDQRWRSIVSIRSVVDGEDALGPKERSTSFESHSCGGVLVRPDVVLTAAHCVTGPTQWFRLVQSRTRVLVGTRTLVDGPKQPGQQIDVLETRMHPSWRGSDDFWDGTPDLRFDVAVLRLSRPVTSIEPITMVSEAEDALWGAGAGLTSGARVAGWGITNALVSDVDIEEADYVQRILREVELPLLPDRECESTDSSMGEAAVDFDRATMICGYAPDRDARPNRSNRRGACSGDSGGPMIVPAADGSWRLAGLVSWGPETAGGCNRASVFTRIAGVRGWVDTTIADFGAPASLTANAPVAARQVGAASMRVEWPAATGAPLRYTLLREIPLLELYPSEFRASAKGMTPAARAFMRRLRVLIPVGSGGRDARSLRVDRLDPRRPGGSRRVAFRIEVRDAQGRTARSAALRVAAPVDGSRPGTPRPSRVRVRRGAPAVSWPAVRDNDCVQRYDIHVRRAGSRAWRRQAVEPGFSCSSWGFFDMFDSDETGVVPTNYRYRASLYRLAPGTWFVRVTAIDRAGNRGVARPIQIRSLRSVARPARICRDLPDGGRYCEWPGGSSYSS